MILGNILSIVVIVAICFGTFAVAPRSRNALYGAAGFLMGFFLLLSGLGSALVGPLDLRPMFIFAPLTIACAVTWYFWKVKPVAANG